MLQRAGMPRNGRAARIQKAAGDTVVAGGFVSGADYGQAPG